MCFITLSRLLLYLFKHNLNIKIKPINILKRVTELTISNPINKLVIPRKNYAYFNTFKETPLHERITTSHKIKKKIFRESTDYCRLLR